MAIALSYIEKGMKWNSATDIQHVIDDLNIHENKVITLCLTGNTLGVQAAEQLFLPLSKQKNIANLLCSDIFTGRKKDEIASALYALSVGLISAQVKLVELDLSDNAFGPNGIVGVTQLIGNECCFTLKILKMNNQGLGHQGCKALVKAMSCARSASDYKGLNLEVFIAGRNRFENEGMAMLTAVFGDGMNSLKELALHQNGIGLNGCKGIEDLIISIRNHKELKILNISDNNIKKNGMELLYDIIPEFTQLEELKMDDCLLKKHGIEILSSLVQDKTICPNLKTISLVGNEMKGNAANTLISAILNGKPYIEKVDLRQNEIKNCDIDKIKTRLREYNKEYVFVDDSEEEEEYSNDDGSESGSSSDEYEDSSDDGHGGTHSSDSDEVKENLAAEDKSNDSLEEVLTLNFNDNTSHNDHSLTVFGSPKECLPSTDIKNNIFGNFFPKPSSLFTTFTPVSSPGSLSLVTNPSVTSNTTSSFLSSLKNSENLKGSIFQPSITPSLHFSTISHGCISSSILSSLSPSVTSSTFFPSSTSSALFSIATPPSLPSATPAASFSFKSAASFPSSASPTPFILTTPYLFPSAASADSTVLPVPFKFVTPTSFPSTTSATSFSFKSAASLPSFGSSALFHITTSTSSLPSTTPVSTSAGPTSFKLAPSSLIPSTTSATSFPSSIQSAKPSSFLSGTSATSFSFKSAASFPSFQSTTSTSSFPSATSATLHPSSASNASFQSVKPSSFSSATSANLFSSKSATSFNCFVSSTLFQSTTSTSSFPSDTSATSSAPSLSSKFATPSSLPSTKSLTSVLSPIPSAKTSLLPFAASANSSASSASSKLATPSPSTTSATLSPSYTPSAKPFSFLSATPATSFSFKSAASFPSSASSTLFQSTTSTSSFTSATSTTLHPSSASNASFKLATPSSLTYATSATSVPSTQYALFQYAKSSSLPSATSAALFSSSMSSPSFSFITTSSFIPSKPPNLFSSTTPLSANSSTKPPRIFSSTAPSKLNPSTAQSLFSSSTSSGIVSSSIFSSSVSSSLNSIPAKTNSLASSSLPRVTSSGSTITSTDLISNNSPTKTEIPGLFSHLKPDFDMLKTTTGADKVTSLSITARTNLFSTPTTEFNALSNDAFPSLQSNPISPSTFSFLAAAKSGGSSNKLRDGIIAGLRSDRVMKINKTLLKVPSGSVSNIHLDSELQQLAECYPDNAVRVGLILCEESATFKLGLSVIAHLLTSPLHWSQSTNAFLVEMNCLKSEQKELIPFVKMNPILPTNVLQEILTAEKLTDGVYLTLRTVLGNLSKTQTLESDDLLVNLDDYLRNLSL